MVGIGAAFAKDNQQSGKAGEYESNQAQPPAPGAINEAAGADTRTFDKEKFIKETSQNGIAEVNMAKLGTAKAQDPELKEVADRLVTDHSKLNDQVKELAQKKGITLSTEIDSKHQKMIDHISGLSGSEFDKAFASHMVQGHKKSIAKFKQAASPSNDDTEIRDFAKTTLPTLQEHLTLVKKYAPESTAGTAVDEPAGAQSEQKDDSSVSPQYKTPDAASPDSSKSENP